MKKKTIFTILLTLFTLTTQAQLLFRISGGEMKDSSYILGTIHYLSDSLLDSIPEYQKAEGMCQQMYVEIKPSMNKLFDSSNVQKQKQERQTLKYQDGKTIFDVIDHKSATILKEKIKEALHINLDEPTWKEFWKCTPAMFQNMLSTNMSRKIRKNGGMDFYLMSKAMKRGWNVGELDDDIQEMGYLSILQEKQPQTIEEQADSLMFFLQNYNELKQQMEQRFETICNYWMIGDFEGFANYYLKEVEQYPNLYKDRNEKWLPKMLSAMREKPTMFIFGAGHLIGEHGVIQLLRNEGLVVEQVKWK